MKTLLVTGASGFLGWNICKKASKDWNIYGTVFSHPVDIEHINVIKIDLRNYGDLKNLFREVRPDAVIHTAANTDPNYCQENSIETYEMNVNSSINIAGICADYRIPCAFTSTDIVFDGLNPPYREEDPVSPVSFYGEQKARAEEGVYKRYPEVSICRMPLMFGIAGPGGSSFLQPMIRAMRENKPLRLFTDEFRTPISGGAAAQGLLLALRKVKGIIHLGGRERISRYDFGVLLRRISGFHQGKLIPCRQREIPMPAPRPSDVSLDSEKAYQMGFDPLSIVGELTQIRSSV